LCADKVLKWSQQILGSIDDSQLKQELLDKQNDHGNTPLHYACFWKYSELAVLLSDQGAQITKKNRYQKTPLDFAGEQLSALLQCNHLPTDLIIALNNS
jgi:hypothetical protein